VRGSLRDPGRANAVRASLEAAGADTSALDFVVLDLTDDSGWQQALRGCRYLQHVASPFLTRMPRDRDVLIRPAVEGTRRALQAALAGEIERVVLTSSMAAIAYGHDPGRTRPFGADDWTRLDRYPVNAYVESKTRAEQAAWTMMEQAGRRSDLVSVNPAVIFGPLIDDDPGVSVKLVKAMLRGLPAVPRLALGTVDVRDVAAVECAAMTELDAGGRRLPLAAGTRWLIELARALASALPERAGRLPKRELPDWLVRLAALFVTDLSDYAGDLGRVRPIDAGPGLALLGRPPISPEASIIASAQSLIQRGLV
jgi:nucleoside-diphosphate-sugar epimerase